MTITRATQKSPDSKRMSDRHVRILSHYIRCLQQTFLVMRKQPTIQGCNRRRASQKFVANTISFEQEHNMKYMLTKTNRECESK